ncbi:MAG: DUF2268 domain-containing putative Zn-dependent protease [Promethearchaeota archaeon]
MQIQNFGSHFIHFYNEIGGRLDAMSDEEIFSRFKDQIISEVPLYYKIIEESFKSFKSNYIFNLYKSHIINQIRNYHEIKETFEFYSNKIIDIINQEQKTLKNFFPDFTIKNRILIGHSMSCFDGGIRVVEDEKFIVFGLDVISRIYKNMSAKPFFVHELFHEYHLPFYQMYKPEGVILDALWTEGLAVYMSELIVSGSSNDEILLNNPEGMISMVEKNIVELSIELEKNLDAHSPELYRKYFLGPLNENNYRAGYYIGYLLVHYLSKKLSLKELIRISGAELFTMAKEFFGSTINSFQDVKAILF